MTSSTDKPGANVPGCCPHRDASTDSLLKSHGQDCPADLSVRCANDILADLRRIESEAKHGRAHDERLRGEFGFIVERALRHAYRSDRIQVFWTLEDAKAIESHSDPASDPRRRSINDVIIQLNRDDRYDSQSLLEALVGLSVGRSHVFSVVDDASGLSLIVRPMLCLQTNRTSDEWSIPIRFQSGSSPHQLIEELMGITAADETQLRIAVRERIEEAISGWVSQTWDEWPEAEFRARLRNEVEQDKARENGFRQLFRSAAEHFALIALFQACNDYIAMSYILAPTMQGRSDSALAVYWPRSTGEGTLILLYLIQMILGQNATTILGEREKRRTFQELAAARKMALGHFGHTLKNRAQGLVANLEQEGGTSTQITLARSLLETGHILELNVVDSMDDILRMPPDKLSRTVEMVSATKHWDILDEMRSRWVPGWLQGRQFVHFAPLKSAILEPEVDYEVKTCLLGACTGYRFRLARGLYRQLFSELFSNIARYSHKTDVGTDAETGLARVACRLWVCREERVRRGSDCMPLLVFVNQTSTRRRRDDERFDDESARSQPFVEAKNLPEWFQESEEWLEWPESRKFDGPGMAVDLLRRLKIGGLYYKTWVETNGKRTFCTGVWLDGMVIE